MRKKIYGIVYNVVSKWYSIFFDDVNAIEIHFYDVE